MVDPDPVTPSIKAWRLIGAGAEATYELAATATADEPFKVAEPSALIVVAQERVTR